MADLDPINPLAPIRPPSAQQSSPNHRRREPQPRPAGTMDDVGEQRDSDPLVDDYA